MLHVWVRWVRARGAESVRTGAVSCDPFTCSSYSTVRVCAVGARCALHSTNYRVESLGTPPLGGQYNENERS